MYKQILYCIISAIKRNSSTSCQSPAESGNINANMQNCGEASPDAVSTTSEGTQEHRDDLVTATVLWGNATVLHAWCVHV